MKGTHVVVVDDDAAILSLMARVLERAGFAVSASTDPRQALAILTGAVETHGAADVLVTDFAMGPMTGGELIEHTRRAGVLVPTLMVSGVCTADTGGQALCREFDEFLAKPFRPDQLLDRVKLLVSHLPRRAVETGAGTLPD